MAYLNSPNLIFTGDFKSDVSTINNDPAHYNNAAFKESFQDFGQGATNGWWNPEGGASFSFQNCRVKRIFLPDGTVKSKPGDDLVLGQPVCDAGERPTGKMVDLDPQEQMTSQLWSVTLCLKTAKNELLVQGRVRPTGFRDLQSRQTAGARVNGQGLGGSWPSVLEDLDWGKKASESPFLQQLQSATQGNRLGLNLHAFGYYYNHAPDGRFSMGRILGTLGPWVDGEPFLFAPTRRLYGILPQSSGLFFNISNFIVEKDRRLLTIDLGGSFPVSDALGTIAAGPKYVVGVSKNSIDAPPGAPVIIDSGDFTEIGPLDYSPGDWLMTTGGIVAFDNLPDDILTALEDNQLLLMTPASAAGKYAVVAREAIDGYLVKADDFVQRLDTGESKEIGIYAYQYGKTLSGRDISVTLEPPTPATPFGPPPNGDPISDIPGNNTPPNGLTFPAAVTTGPDGRASFTLTGNQINSPRGYMDGQIYSIDYQINGIDSDPAEGAVMPQETIYVHLRDFFPVIRKPQWKDISQIMIQYSNLYPIMSKYLVDLSDPAALLSKKEILIFAFTRPIEDSLHMPVTRDLSEGKRRTILNFLGAPPGPAAVGTAIAEAASKESAAQPDSPAPASGGLTVGLTANQQKFKKATLDKGGGSEPADDTENLFENI